MRGMYGTRRAAEAARARRERARHRRLRRRAAFVARDGRWPAAQRVPEQAGRSQRAAERCRGGARGAGLMELTALQQDALIELLNIGFGRAAASLSQLTGHRVLLDVPRGDAARGRRGRRSARARRARPRGERASDLHRPGRGRRAAHPRRVGRGDPEGAADQRAGAAALDRRVGARGDHRGRQHPAQRVPGHLRQPAERAGVVLGAAPEHRERRRDSRVAAGQPAGHPLRAGRARRVPAARCRR